MSLSLKRKTELIIAYREKKRSPLEEKNMVLITASEGKKSCPSEEIHSSSEGNENIDKQKSLEVFGPRYFSNNPKVDWNALRDQADKRTWEMYERLEKDPGTFDPEKLKTILSLREKDPNYKIRNYDRDLVEYYFRRSCYESPYHLLRVYRNRYQYAELILPGIEEESDEIMLGCWHSLNKDQQYISLAQGLEKLEDGFSQVQGVCWSGLLQYALDFAKANRLNLLLPADIKGCLSDLIIQKVGTRRLEQLRSFCSDLISKHQQEILPADCAKLKAAAESTYNLLCDGEIDYAMGIAYPGGFKRASEVVLELMEERCYWLKKSFEGMTLDYIRLKLQIAKEIGLIIETENGFFVDAYDPPAL